MGCCASKESVAPAPGSVAFAAALGPPPHLQAATARTVRLLESLAAKEERVEQPVLTNSERLRSGQRGNSEFAVSQHMLITLQATKRTRGLLRGWGRSVLLTYLPRLERRNALVACYLPAFSLPLLRRACSSRSRSRAWPSARASAPRSALRCCSRASPRARDRTCAPCRTRLPKPSAPARR